MPFCTECGARHADDAKVCPNCGEPIFASPGEDDLDNIVASLDDEVKMGDELPEVEPLAPGAPAEPSSDYMVQIDQIRSQIAAQSSSLQSLTDLSWSNPAVARVRAELGDALEQLRGLTPPAAVASGHADFLDGAELLADGFQRLVDASQRPNDEAAVAEAEMAIAEATNRFLRGADALNEYFMLEEAGLADQLPPEPPGPSAQAAPDLDLDEELAALDLPEPPPLEEEEEETGIFPPQPAASSPTAHLGGPAPSYFAPPPEPAPDFPEPDFREEAQAGAWAGLGDPSSDAMLLEIEAGWVRGRTQVHEAIERAIRSAVADAIRGSLASRLRIEQEARGTLERIAAERNRLIDEVESLRREAHGLQTELAELRRGLNELERERQIAQDRRQQMFADAEAHRASLLREIEQLGGQLDSMRKNIVSLLNMSVGTTGTLAAEEPSAAAPPATAPPAAAPLAAPSPSLERPAAGQRPAAAPAARPAPAPSALSSPVASSDAGVTEVRIGGVTSLGKNLQIQQAIKALPGVTVEGQPRYRSGVITATLRHAPDFDVAEALAGLPDQPLSLTGSPAPGVLELAAT